MHETREVYEISSEKRIWNLCFDFKANTCGICNGCLPGNKTSLNCTAYTNSGGPGNVPMDIQKAMGGGGKGGKGGKSKKGFDWHS